MIEKLVELIKKTSTSLSPDVETALKDALAKEESGSRAAVILETILKNCEVARQNGVPLCQDTGTLTFFVDERLRNKVTDADIKAAVRIATERGYLRKNCIDSITGKSYDDNTCEGAPVIHYVNSLKAVPAVTLLMKGGGSENVSRQYSLPDATLGAGRDMAGVRKCIIDAVQKAQGYGCAPGLLGVCIGGDRATGYEVAKEQLLLPISDDNAKLIEEVNSLGIGPMGLGGKTTVLDIKIASRPRVPASFFVTIAYMCWAVRRRTVEVEVDNG